MYSKSAARCGPDAPLSRKLAAVEKSQSVFNEPSAAWTKSACDAKYADIAEGSVGRFATS